MRRALVIYYSQSGETARVARMFAGELSAAGVSVMVDAIEPLAAYPYPWRSIVRFFDAMPDAVLGAPVEIAPLHFDPAQRFDVLVFAYPVWFLSPATPVQAFFGSRYANVLRGTDVITISVSRAMWQRASLTVKRLLAGAGAIHCDNIVATHQGSPLATFISTPRALLFGKRDRLMGVFPRAGVSDADMARIRRLASIVARRLVAGRAAGAPFLRGEPAVAVTRWLVIPEWLGGHYFRLSARVIRQLGRVHRGLRVAGVLGFAIGLVFLILVALPVTVLGGFIAGPLIDTRLNAYIARLAAPTGEVNESREMARAEVR